MESQKAKLIEKLWEKGVMAQGKLVDVQKLAVEQGIPVKEEIQKVIQGWEGKPKVLCKYSGNADSSTLTIYSNTWCKGKGMH